MSLSIFIDTSSSTFSLVIEENGALLFHSNEEESLIGCKDIAELINTGFEKIGKKINAINTIAVNTGPGATNSIRSGVSFANSLGYSLKIPVCSFSSFETMGIEAWNKFQVPVICTAKAINRNAFFGIYDNGDTGVMKFGKLKELIQTFDFKSNEFAIAGPQRTEVMELMSDYTCHDSGIQFGNPAVLIEVKDLIFKRKLLYPDFVRPIGEQSNVFYANGSV